MTYIYIMHDQKPLNETIILEHVLHLKQLRKEARLVLCGPFTDIQEEWLCSKHHQKMKLSRLPIKTLLFETATNLLSFLRWMWQMKAMTLAYADFETFVFKIVFVFSL